MAFDINTKQATGQTLTAELWRGNTKNTTVGSSGTITLTESGTSGFYYATSISLAGVADNVYYIRIYDGSAYIDEIGEVVVKGELTYEDYMSRRAGVGYANGYVYLDRSVTNSNTVPYVDGTLDNPVRNITAAQTLCAALGFNRIYIKNSVSNVVTLSASIANYKIDGSYYTLELNGQDISGAQISNAELINGSYLGSTATIRNSRINTLTGPGITMHHCILANTLTHTSGNTSWRLHDCRSEWTGPVGLPFNANSVAFLLFATNFHGNLEFKNGSGNTVALTGKGGFKNDTGSTILNLSLIGHWDYDNSGTVSTYYEDDVNKLIRDVLVDTNELQTNQGSWLTATGFATPSDIGLLETNVLSEINGNETLLNTVLNNQGDLLTEINANEAKIDNVDADIVSLQTHGDSNWSTATGFATVNPDNAGIAANGVLLSLFKKYHDNDVKFFAADGTTESKQADAYFMTVYDDNGTTVLKRIEFKNAAGNPATIADATRYEKT